MKKSLYIYIYIFFFLGGGGRISSPMQPKQPGCSFVQGSEFWLLCGFFQDNAESFESATVTGEYSKREKSQNAGEHNLSWDGDYHSFPLGTPKSSRIVILGYSFEIQGEGITLVLHGFSEFP